MLKHIFSCLLIGFCMPYLMAQNPTTLKPKDVKIIRNGDTLNLNNIGGLNAPIYSSIDFNNDGVEDLLIFDKISREIIPLVHSGNENAIEYRFAPEYISAFPSLIEDFILTYDYNCDGIKDIVYRKYNNMNVNLYVEKGYYVNNQIRFALVSEQVLYEQNGNLAPISLISGDLPALVDVDGDGDMDIVSFTNVNFEYIYHVMYFKNYSAELGFGCDSLKFKGENPCFGQFEELGSDFNTIVMSYSPDSCANNIYWHDWRNNPQPRHGGSTLTAIDHDMDGVIDLVMGDDGTNTLNLISLRNMNGTLVAYEQDSVYPANNTTINISTFPAAYYIDVNNDGKKDLIAASSHYSIYGSVKDTTSWLYLNHAATAQNALDMQLENNAFLYDDMLDLGAYAYPTFVDLNNDGLMDLVVGNGFTERSNGDISSFLQAFLNVGTISEPIFELIDEDFANLSTLGYGHFSTSFADINGDGALDMVLGSENIFASIYINRAPLGSIPIYDTPENNTLDLSYGYSKPDFYDFDGDGDQDLVFGDSRGQLIYFENTGTATNFQFAFTATNDRFGLFSLNSLQSAYSAPRVIQSNNNINIIVGHQNGQVLSLSNIDNNMNGSFAVDNFSYEHFAFAEYANLAPAIADIDGDNILDMVIGNSRGGLTFFRSTPIPEDTIISVNKINISNDINVYPNPAKDIVHLDFAEHLTHSAVISLYNIHGQLLLQRDKALNENKISISTNEFNAGIYFINVQNQYYNSSKALILNK